MSHSSSDSAGLRLFVVYVTLNDEPFIEASLESVYPFAAKIFVLTAFDRAWDGTRVVPDRTLEKVLSFPDPDDKICCIKMWCPDEALARNWVMHAALHPMTYELNPHVFDRDAIDRWLEPPDYFWIVDGDEIYDPETLPQILDYVKQHPARYIKVWAHIYFKTWNYRVVDLQPFTVFVRPGTFLAYARGPHFPRVIDYIGLIPRVGAPIADRLSGHRYVPPEIGVFHHPAYVGDTARIATKIAHTPHQERLRTDWLENVWAKWSPDSTNFHPTNPPEFRRAVYVPDEDLPAIISKRRWPPGYAGQIA